MFLQFFPDPGKLDGYIMTAAPDHLRDRCARLGIPVTLNKEKPAILRQ